MRVKSYHYRNMMIAYLLLMGGYIWYRVSDVMYGTVSDVTEDSSKANLQYFI